MKIRITKVTQKFLKIYVLDFNTEGKTDLFISSHFYAAGGSVGDKMEQGKKNNNCNLAEGSKGRKTKQTKKRFDYDCAKCGSIKAKSRIIGETKTYI